MNEFPRDIRSVDGEAPTKIVCPDCGGNITVCAIGDDVLVIERGVVDVVGSIEGLAATLRQLTGGDLTAATTAR